MSRVHHKCYCNGREFALDEWCAFTKTAEYDEAVHTSPGGFRFRITDGCINPHTFGYKNAKCSYEVRTCQSDDGMWMWGYQYDGPTFGGGCSATFHATDPTAPIGLREPAFKTEKECICDCLGWLRKQFEHYKKTPNHYNEDGSLFCNIRSEVRDILKHIDADLDKYDPRQLELFE